MKSTPRKGDDMGKQKAGSSPLGVMIGLVVLIQVFTNPVRSLVIGLGVIGLQVLLGVLLKKD